MTVVRDAVKSVFDLLRRRDDPVRVTLAHTLKGHTGSIMSVAFLPDGDYLFSASLDGTVRKWRVSDGCEVGKVMKHGDLVSAIAVSPDGKLVAGGDGGSRVLFWSTDTCEKVAKPAQRIHGDWITSLSFAPASQTVASSSSGGSVMVWSTLTGERMAELFQGQGLVSTSVSFSLSGDKLAACQNFGDEVLIWDIHEGKATGPPIRLTGSGVRSVVWSLDNRQLICAGVGGIIKFIDPSNDTILATCRGHTKSISSVAISHDGTFLASASWDRTVRLCSTSTHQQLASLKHPKNVNSVSISPNGRYLASGCFDRKLRIWQVQDVTPQEGNGDAPASDTDPPSSRPEHVSNGPVDHPTTVNDKADDGDQPESSGDSQGDRPNMTTANDSYLDLPAVLPPRAAVDGVHTHLFDLGDPEASQPNVTSDARRGKWKKKAKESRQYLSQHIKHFREGILPRHGASNMSVAARPPSSQKLKDRISRIHRRASLTPENARNGNSDQQPETDGKSPKVTLVSNARLEQRLVVASTDPPVQQEKLYLIMKDGKLVRRPDPPVQATAQTQRCQPTPASSTIPSSSTTTQGQAQGQVVYNDDDEVCGCCGYLLIRK